MIMIGYAGSKASIFNRLDELAIRDLVWLFKFFRKLPLERQKVS
jgi:hypothetical protein